MLKTLVAAALALTLPALPAAAQQDYPTRQVSVLIPFTAGGTADIFARMVSEHLQKQWGQPFVPENVSGSGGALAMGRLARSAPDGYTIALASTSNLAVHPTLLGDRIQYQTLRDLAPITQISIVPNLLAVNPERIKARSVPELIAYLKANPGKVTFGSAGIGTTQHLAGELFQIMTGTTMVHVPYKGSSQMVPDLVSGQIDIAFDNAPLLLPQAKAGKLVLLATATKERVPFDPNLPTVAETVPGFEAVAWHGFLAPIGTPAPIIDKLAKGINAFMEEPATKQRVLELGAIPVHTSPDAFKKLIADETERWKKVIETAKVKVE